jgi:hypothetical protein
MNHMMSIARFAGQQCARFTALFLLTLKELVSILQINSYAHLWISRVQHAINAGVIHILDRRDILQARAHKRAHTAPLKRIARWVALGLVGALCLPMSHASSGSIDAIDPKTYIRFSMDKREALCLIKLYGKESAFDSTAIGNLKGKYHTYGIPQLKNALIAEKSPIEQVRYGVKYINHRYDGDTCKALHHFNRVGWH